MAEKGQFLFVHKDYDNPVMINNDPNGCPFGYDGGLWVNVTGDWIGRRKSEITVKIKEDKAEVTLKYKDKDGSIGVEKTYLPIIEEA